MGRVIRWIVAAWIIFQVINGLSRFMHNQNLRNQAATCTSQGQLLGAAGCFKPASTMTPNVSGRTPATSIPPTPRQRLGGLLTPREYATEVAAEAAQAPTPKVDTTIDESDAAYCLTSPIYPAGTRITVTHQIVFYQAATSGTVNLYDYPRLEPRGLIPAGTVVEISGPFVEKGVCDYWPVRYQVVAGHFVEDRYADERDLRSTN